MFRELLEYIGFNENGRILMKMVEFSNLIVDLNLNYATGGNEMDFVIIQELIQTRKKL